MQLPDGIPAVAPSLWQSLVAAAIGLALFVYAWRVSRK